MKQKYLSFHVLIILASAGFALPTGSAAEEAWHYQASAEVRETGLAEAVLPPGLFFSDEGGTQVSRTDLSLIGPDGNPRSFELYWKEKSGSRSAVLKPSRIRFDRTSGLVWEAPAPKGMTIENVRIDFAAPQTVGQVTIEGRDGKGWRRLAENAALYDALSSTGVDIEPAPYEQLRLSFKGFSREFKETTFPVRSVTVSGKSTAKDYAEQYVDLRFEDARPEKTITISSVLPGAGLWIRNISLSTEAQFQGAWEAGRETIIDGKAQFQALVSGTVSTVGKQASVLDIPVNRSWPGRSLVVKLRPEGTYVGRITRLRIAVMLPRMAFFADKTGTYRVRTGSGDSAAIKETPGDEDRKIANTAVFSAVSENKQWAPARLAERYLVAGGPFSDAGFRWKATVRVPDAGYFRLVLNQEASLSPRPEKVRLVRDNVQVPFFNGAGEEREIVLKPTVDYDKAHNKTSWSVVLPSSAERITEMLMEADGIFERTVKLETPRPGHSGWQPWKTLHWSNTSRTPSVLRARLADMPKDAVELRITMDHGDNRPIEISTIRVTYNAPTLFFITDKPGAYSLFGGNPKIPDAKYDIALVRAHLVDEMPRSLEMGSIEPYRSSEIRQKILEVFEDKSWGLYAVLGLVTAALLVLIVRLFPKEKKG